MKLKEYNNKGKVLYTPALVEGDRILMTGLPAKKYDKAEKQELRNPINLKRKVLVMRQILISIIFLMVAIACEAQVNSNYRTFWEASPDAADYLVFVEVLQDTNQSQLADSIDWNEAGLTPTTSTANLFYSFESANNSDWLRSGIVPRTASGTWGMMNTSGFFRKDSIPAMVGSVGWMKE